MSAQLPSAIKKELVSKAEAIAEKATGGEKAKGKRAEGQVAQLRNMIQVTQTEGEVAVLANFIRYQAGRKATSAFWQPIEADVVAVLRDVEKDSRLEDAALKHRAIQHFFGYLVRHYVYLTREDARPEGSAGHGPQGGAQRRRS